MNQKKKGTKNDFDIKYLGPGIWHSIHKLSCDLYTSESVYKSMNQIKKLISSLKCDCLEDAIKYIEENPIENNALEKDNVTLQYIGLAKWTWTFHNSVNIRLGKVWLSWEVFVLKYMTDKSCSQ